jgi:hypothetical protein
VRYSRCILQLELLGFLRLINFWCLGNWSWTVATNTLLNARLILGFHGCVLNNFLFAILFIFVEVFNKAVVGAHDASPFTDEIERVVVSHL